MTDGGQNALHFSIERVSGRHPDIDGLWFHVEHLTGNLEDIVDYTKVLRDMCRVYDIQGIRFMNRPGWARVLKRTLGTTTFEVPTFYAKLPPKEED